MDERLFNSIGLIPQMAIFTTKCFLLRKVAKILLAVLLSLLAIICIALAVVQTNWGQNWLAKKVTAKLSKDLQNRISIDKVSIGFFNKLNLNGVLIEDRKQDTLLYAGVAQVRITDWFFFKDQADLEYIGLENAVIHINRKDSVWNYAFLEDYFAASPSKEQKKAGIEFNLKKVALKNVSFVQKDGWIGVDKHIKIGALLLDANNLSITKKIIDINSLQLESPLFHQATYTGNRPPSTSTLR